MQALEAALESEETADETSTESTSAPSSQEAPASTDTNHGATIDGASIEDLIKAADAASKLGAPKPDAEATEHPGGTPAPEAAAPPKPETTEEEEDDEEAPTAAATPIAKNFRFHTEDPRMASYLKALKAAQQVNPDVNPAEVAATVGYKMPGVPIAPAVAAPAAMPSEPPPPDPLVTALESEITAIDAKIEHAETVEYDAKAVRALERERQQKVWELKNAQEAVAAQAAADAEFDAGYQTAREKVSALCPEADDENTAQFDLVLAEVARVKRTDPKVLDDFGYPLVILQRVAVKHPALFPNVVKKAAQPVVPVTPAKPPVKPGQPASRPVGVVAPGTSPGPTLNASNAKAAIANLTADQLIALANDDAAIRRSRKG